MKIERPKPCGRKGRLARGFIRDLVQGREIDLRRTRRALIHVEGCDYCQESIDSAIRGARAEGHRSDYLRTVPETLYEAGKRLEAVRIRGERSLY